MTPYPHPHPHGSMAPSSNSTCSRVLWGVSGDAGHKASQASRSAGIANQGSARRSDASHSSGAGVAGTSIGSTAGCGSGEIGNLSTLIQTCSRASRAVPSLVSREANKTTRRPTTLRNVDLHFLVMFLINLPETDKKN